uniref:Uncharacterized protein n=1 Tax=Anopheles stephensi TaxID=30069 RepID=A0A182YQB8_ANOST
MNRDVFSNLKQLQQLTIHNCSGIGFTASVLDRIERIDVKHSVVHNISSVFDPLPLRLEVVHFEAVQSQQSSTLALRSPGDGESVVQNITVVQCMLTSAVVKDMPLLVSLNLSTNLLTESSVELVNLPALVSLILSHNAFETVTAHSLRIVNLSHNQLLSMPNMAKPHARLERIETDGNPWDCSWLDHCRLLNPTLFNVFRYNKRYDVLTVWGLPCLLQTAPTEPGMPPLLQSVLTDPATTTQVPVISYPLGNIMPRGKKISITTPRFTVPNSLKVLMSVSVGVLVSNVIILLYNRYRNIVQQPFYRLLSTSLSTRDTVTEKSTSFWYEVPVGEDSNAMPMNHIYEEIRDGGAQRDTYDALNFHRDRQQGPDETSSGSLQNSSSQ